MIKEVKNRVKAKNSFYRVKKLSIARALVNSNRTGVGFLQGKLDSHGRGVSENLFFRREGNFHGLLGPPLTRALVISLRGALINFFSGHFIRLCVNFALRLVKNRVKAKNAFYRVKKLSIARALVNSTRTGVGLVRIFLGEKEMFMVYSGHRLRGPS